MCVFCVDAPGVNKAIKSDSLDGRLTFSYFYKESIKVFLNKFNSKILEGDL